MICPQCGTDGPEAARFCVSCRYEFVTKPTTAPSPSAAPAAPVPPAAPAAYAPASLPAAYPPTYPAPYPPPYPPPYGAPYPAPYPAPYGAPQPSPNVPYGAPYPAPYPSPYPPPYPLPYGAPGPFVPPAQARAEMLAASAATARWGGAMIDATLMIAIWLMLLAYVRPKWDATNTVPFFPFTAAMGLSYYIVPDAVGATTLGKFLTRVRLVNIDLRPANAGQVAVRGIELILWVVLGGVIFLIVEIVLASKNGQTLGDRMARVYVVRKKDMAPADGAPAAPA